MKKWFSDVANHDWVKIGAVCLMLAVIIKGCEVIEDYEIPESDETFKGLTPDCSSDKKSTEVQIKGERYNLVCK